MALTVTDTAVGAIRQLTLRHGRSTAAGIRIADDEGRRSLTVSIADGPEAGDRVVVGIGAPVYLDPVAVSILNGRALDAEVDDSGAIVFSVTDVGD